MTINEALAQVQGNTGCEHAKALKIPPGEPCDMKSGGWWTCGCLVMAYKLIGDTQQNTRE